MGTITFFSVPDPVVWWQVALVLLGHAVGSFSIGCVGVGGVVYVPLLLLLPGMDSQTAVGCAFFSVFSANLPKTYVWGRAGKILWRRSLDLALPAIPGSLLGAYLVTLLPKGTLSVVVSLICFASSINIACGLRPKPEILPHEELLDENDSTPTPPIAVEQMEEEPEEEAEAAVEEGVPPQLGSSDPVWVAKRAFIGFCVAVASSMTGTGGPVLMLPLFFALWPNTPPHLLIGTMLPFIATLSASATIGALSYGKIDLGVALVMAVNNSLTTTLGSHAGLYIPGRSLKKGLVVLLFATGCMSLTFWLIRQIHSEDDDSSLADNVTEV